MNDECFICGSPNYHTYHSLINICNSCEDMINAGKMTVYKKVQLHVAHMLPGHSTCGTMHGHTVDVVIGVRGRMNFVDGMVMDFKSLKEILQKEIVDRFDHGCLNDTIPCPTAEYFAAYLYFQLLSRGLDITMVRVHETDNNYVEFAPDRDRHV